VVADDQQQDRFGFPRASGFPELDSAAMVEADYLMTACFGAEIPALMERAGAALAQLAERRYFAGNASGRRVMVMAGSGGNGAGAMIAGRRLAERGADVRLVLSSASAPDRVRDVTQAAMDSLVLAGIRLEQSLISDADLILDGMVGYSLGGAPRGRLAALISAANAQVAPILSLDVPSGFDALYGRLCEPAIRADATLALSMPKRGLLAPCFAHAVGAVYLADLNMPAELYRRLSVPVEAPAFRDGPLLRLIRPGEIRT
jgi:NAD(P)H-hydrate epimerase